MSIARLPFLKGASTGCRLRVGNQVNVNTRGVCLVLNDLITRLIKQWPLPHPVECVLAIDACICRKSHVRLTDDIAVSKLGCLLSALRYWRLILLITLAIIIRSSSEQSTTLVAASSSSIPHTMNIGELFIELWILGAIDKHNASVQRLPQILARTPLWTIPRDVSILHISESNLVSCCGR